MPIEPRWRGDFEDWEADALHAEAFDSGTAASVVGTWRTRVARHSLGWVTARDGGRLVGFANVVWDGLVHAWIQDVMVAVDLRNRGVGTRMVQEAAAGVRRAGCEWLHADFDESLGDFYFGACGFTPTTAGLIRLD